MSKAARPHGGSAGFSLVEALVALYVLAFGLVVCAGLFADALRVEYRAAQTSLATFLVVDKAEALRTATALYPGGDIGAVPEPGFGEYLATRDGIVADVPGPEGASLVRVWRVEDTRPRRIQVAVYPVSGTTARTDTPLAFASTSVPVHP